jgi:hypothetical protein
LPWQYQKIIVGCVFDAYILRQADEPARPSTITLALTCVKPLVCNKSGSVRKAELQPRFETGAASLLPQMRTTCSTCGCRTAGQKELRREPGRGKPSAESKDPRLPRLAIPGSTAMGLRLLLVPEASASQQQEAGV